MMNDPVKIDTGYVSGVVLGGVKKRVRVYRGIPYAASAAGEFRWRPPQPVEPWKGIRECTQWGNRSPQRPREGFGEIGENCLNLNVLTPAKKTNDCLPVMVWFHGGGLGIMTANSPLYCYTALPQHGVVVVTVNSRLDAIGYMAHPALTAESGNRASGNSGTMDLIASLKWVQRNITAFGGDPGNVTIFGESGGGTKVLSCMTSPLAKGLFHRAIIQSGSALTAENASTPLERAEGIGEKIVEHLGLSGEKDVLSALRAMPWVDVTKAGSKVGFFPNLTIDGYVLPGSVHNIFKSGKQIDVPLMVGANAGEEGELTQRVPFTAANMANVSSKAYAYVFSHVPKKWTEEGCVAFHGIEVPYVFGYLRGLSDFTLIGLSKRGGAKSGNPGLERIDDTIADNMMRTWVQFAKTGDPNVEGLTPWPPYEASTQRYMDFGKTFEVKSGIEKAFVKPPA